MSTLVYAAISSKRIQAQATKSVDAEPPGVKTYVDTLAALIPGEVLAIHALIVSTSPVESIPKWSIWALAGVCVILYIFGRVASKAAFEVRDLARGLVPPLAFIAWMMLQKPSLVDVNWPELTESSRLVITLIGAVVLGAAAAMLGVATDKAAKRA